MYGDKRLQHLNKFVNSDLLETYVVNKIREKWKKSRHKIVEVTRSRAQLDPRCDPNDVRIKKRDEFIRNAYRRRE